jgi:hypothetical protein
VPNRTTRERRLARRHAHAAREDHRGQEPRPSEQRAERKAKLKAARAARRARFSAIVTAAVVLAAAPAGARPADRTPPNVRVWHDPRLRVIRPYRAWLARTRACESGGRYNTNTGNGFFGAYQFTVRSWFAAGGRGMPHLASRREQDYRAVRLLLIQGAGAWPVCG